MINQIVTIDNPISQNMIWSTINHDQQTLPHSWPPPPVPVSLPPVDDTSNRCMRTLERERETSHRSGDSPRIITEGLAGPTD